MADEYTELIDSIKKLNEAQTKRARDTDDAVEAEKKMRKAESEWSKRRIQASKQEKQAFEKFAKSLGTLRDGFLSLGQTAISPLVGAFKQGIDQFNKFEMIGAKFNTSLTKTFKSNEQLAQQIGGSTGFVTAMEAMGTRLDTQRVGLNINSKGLQRLYKSTVKSGEDFKAITLGIRSATAGLDVNTEHLLKSNESLVTTLGVTRTDLVAAMNSLSENTKHMQAALGIQGMQGSMAKMSGLLKDPALMKQMTSNFEGLLGPGGLQKSVMLGVEGARKEMLTGGVNLQNMLETVFKGAARAKEMVGGAKGTMLGPEILQALKDAGILDETNIRLMQTIKEEAKEILGDALTGQETGRELAEKLAKKIEEDQLNQKEFTDSLATLKKSILVPFINAGALLATSIKKFLLDNKDQIIKFGKSVAVAIVTVVGKLFEIAEWIGNNILPHLKAIAATMASLAAAKKAEQTAGMIGSLLSVIPIVGGPLAAVATKIGTKVLTRTATKGLIAQAGRGALGRAAVASARREVGGRAATKLLGGAAGIGTGIMAHKLLSGGEGKEGTGSSLMSKMLEAMGKTQEEISENTKKGAAASTDLAEIEKSKENRGNLKELVSNLDGFARFQVRQSSLIEEGLALMNGNLIEVTENTGMGAAAGAALLDKPLLTSPMESIAGPQLTTPS